MTASTNDKQVGKEDEKQRGRDRRQAGREGRGETKRKGGRQVRREGERQKGGREAFGLDIIYVNSTNFCAFSLP